MVEARRMASRRRTRRTDEFVEGRLKPFGASFPWFYPRTKEREPLTRNRARKIKGWDLPAAVPARKGRAGRFAPLPAAPTAGQESGSSEQSEGDKERHPMNPILKLHMSGLGEGETPTLAIDPCATERRKAGALEPDRVLDRLGNHRLSIERTVAKLARDPAGIPSVLYEAKIKRG
jgi:hypothetical protein